MKKLILLLALIGLLFSACETVDFPFVDPPKRLLKSLTDLDEDKIFELTYQDGQVDSILIIGGANRGAPRKFRVTYMDTMVIGLTESFTIGFPPLETNYVYPYTYSYTDEQIVIQDTKAYYPDGRVLETTRTYDLEPDRRLVNTIHFLQLEKRGDSVLSVVRDYIRGFTWDNRGHNITEETRNERPFSDPTAPYVEVYRAEYSYDKNPNPFWGLMRPYFPAINDPVRYLSKNNVVSVDYNRDGSAGNPTVSTLTYTYTYGEKDFPETLNILGTVNSNWKENLLFEYR